MSQKTVQIVIIYFGWLKLDCISGDFEDFSMYKIK